MMNIFSYLVFCTGSTFFFCPFITLDFIMWSSTVNHIVCMRQPRTYISRTTIEKLWYYRETIILMIVMGGGTLFESDFLCGHFLGWKSGSDADELEAGHVQVFVRNDLSDAVPNRGRPLSLVGECLL